MDNQKNIICPNCQAEMPIAKSVQKGEILTCSDCSLDVEVINTKPLKIAKAPEVEEDWGE